MSPDAIKAFADRFALVLMLGMICDNNLPADYRRALLRQELKTMGNAHAEEFFERVTGRLEDDDPLLALMMGG